MKIERKKNLKKMENGGKTKENEQIKFSNLIKFSVILCPTIRGNVSR